MIEVLQIENKREVRKYFSPIGDICYTLPVQNKKTPFIIILHSLGKNEYQAIKLANLLPENAFVLSVRAPIEWRVDGNESYAWFDIKGPMIEQFCKESDIVDSINYLIKIIEECKSHFAELDDPIILGFSQGGIVGLTMAVEGYYPIKGVFCHCGFYETKLNRNLHNHDTNILMTNGFDDYVIPGIWAQNSSNILREKCSKFESEFLQCGHEVNDVVLNKLNYWLRKII